MNNVSRVPWWASWSVGAQPARDDEADDFADMGTAFGLDASMAAHNVPPIDAMDQDSGESAPLADRLNRRSVR